MHFQHPHRNLLWLWVILALLLGSCSREKVTLAPEQVIATETPTPTLTNTLTVPAPTTYPGPAASPTLPSGATAYPGVPPATSAGPYPGIPLTPAPITPSPADGGRTTLIPPRIGTATLTPTGLFPTLVFTGTVTERPITTSEPPPQPPIVTVSIWHSWNAAEQQVLDYALRQFQTVHPNVAFMVLYVPKDELLSRYNSAAYRNTGPSILLAPAEWGPAFYDQGLVLDVSEIADPAFLATINSAALDESRYQGALIGLPHSIRSGVVMYRNTQIIPTAPATFDELLVLAQAATGSGKAGAYLDRSFEFSGANLIGVGGRWMDENGRPAFNDRSGLDWMSLLNAYKQAGVAGLNTDRDVQLFKTGKIGIIFESTLRQAELAEAVGEENLSIDPWPAYGGGTLSGFLYTDSIYVNPRTTGDERYNALLVMGFFVAPEVQAIFSTAGHIPVVTEIRLEDAVMQAEVEAFKKATAYPVDPIFAAYPESIRQMLRAIFEQNTDPSAALDLAEQEILNKLNE